ncbi:hypothetical protein [Acinetobacter modestus]|uniref:hypothetical protein n=1 Tax=Acinetobacter modestus TaxID=1776740 RepID=UPI001F4B4C19|nr:hypothetical protein [Acinetobacter modestus]MCH7329616.1 hypothetical protein [Acinetobacter modestus]
MTTQIYGNLQHFKDQVEEWKNVVTEKLDSYSNIIDDAFTHFNDTNNSADYLSVEQTDNRHSLESLTSEKNIANIKIAEIKDLVVQISQDGVLKFENLYAISFDESGTTDVFENLIAHQIAIEVRMNEFLVSMNNYEHDYVEGYNNLKSKNSLSSLFRAINGLRHSYYFERLLKLTKDE